MMMTPEQQTYLLAQLDRKWPVGQRVCQGCGKAQGNWQVLGIQHSLPYTGSNEIVLGGVVVPTVVLACAECGWSMMWSALLLGVVDQSGRLLPLPSQVEIVKDDLESLPEWQRKLVGVGRGGLH
jgi:hypothetical protein